jgi:hypothetical protein
MAFAEQFPISIQSKDNIDKPLMLELYYSTGYYYSKVTLFIFCPFLSVMIPFIHSL